MSEKSATLSIVIRTVDQATAKLKAINERLDEVTKPVRDFKKQLGELGEKSGLSGVAEGFKGVGEAVKETLFKVLEVGAIIGEATHLVLEMVESFERLGKTAKRIGVSADFLAGMRDAAERTGVPLEALDSGLEAFNVNLGQARAGTGRMAKFLQQVYPPLLNQLKATKDNAEAFDVLADTMAKLKDPAKRAALAQKTLGDPALAETFMQGGKGLKEMREHYIALAGPQEEAVKVSEETHEAMLNLKASTDGVKASLVEGLAPALKVIIKQLGEWLRGHREDIKVWAKEIGEKLPGAFREVAKWLGKAYDKVSAFVDAVGGLKNVAIGVGLILAGPLLGSVVKLTAALFTALSRVVQLGKALGGLPSTIPGATIPGGGGGGGVAGGLGKIAGTAALPFGAGMALGHVVDRVTGFDPGKSWINSQYAFKQLQEFHKDPLGLSRPSQAAGVNSVMDAAGIAHAPRSPLEAVMASMAKYNEANAAPKEQQQAKIVIDIKNAPPGTRARTDPKSTADVDLNVGYQLSMGVVP